MSAPISLAETSVRQLLDQLVDDAVDHAAGPGWQPQQTSQHQPLTEQPEEEEEEERAEERSRDAVDGTVPAGRSNPAYEPSVDDPTDSAAVRLPDATTDETETDDERESPPPPPPPPPPPSQTLPPPPSQTHQTQTHQPRTSTVDAKVLLSDRMPCRCRIQTGLAEHRIVLMCNGSDCFFCIRPWWSFSSVRLIAVAFALMPPS